MRYLQFNALAALLIGFHVAALAEGPPSAWPTKTIHVVVPLTPGSATDILARTLAERLSAKYGQAVIVENRPGASTTVGAGAVARAEPDGYTVLVTSSAHTVAPFLYPNLSYDTARDLAAVTPLANLPTVLVVPPDSGYRTLNDLVEAARAKPGVLNFGSAAASTQLNAARFRRSAGFEAVHVPFKGAPEALNEVMAGRIDFYFSPIMPVLPLLKEGRLRALAIGSSKRSSALPDLPTTIEAGYPDSDYNFWIGAFLPGKTPLDLVDCLYEDTVAVLRSPKVRERVLKLGAEPMTMTPRQFDAYVKDELRTNEALVKAAGIMAN